MLAKQTIAAALGVAVLALMPAGTCLGAEPQVGQDTIAIQIGSAAPVTMTAEDVA